MSYNPHSYIPELDGVRGMAILLVMLYHCFPSRITGLGWIGVDLFFVLSGFLITGILLDSKGSKRYYSNFIGRRVLRIFPLFYVVLFFMLFLFPALGIVDSQSDYSFYTRHQDWFWVYLQNWLYSFHDFPENLTLYHFWSLGVEEQFYMVWPWIILFIPKRAFLKVCIGLCLLAIVFRVMPLSWTSFAPPYRYVNTISRMDALIIGGMIAYLVRTKKKWIEKMALPVGLVALSIFILALVLNQSEKFMDLPLYYTAIDLFMGLVLFLGISNVKWLRKILRFKILTFLGKYSYGLYVYHSIIYVLLRYKLVPWLVKHMEYRSSNLLMMLVGSSTIILTLIIGVLSYHLFEIHFLKLKRYFRKDKDLQETLIKEPLGYVNSKY